MSLMESLREYVTDTQPVWWFVYGGSRNVVAGVLLVAVFGVYFLLGSFGLFALTRGTPMMWLFNGLVDGLLTVVTLVLAISQIVLSQQFDSVGDLYDRLEQMIDFRELVEETTESDVTPIVPADFLSLLFSTLSNRAETLDESIANSSDQQLQSDIGEFVTDVTTQMDSVQDEVETAEGTFGVLLAVLNYNNSRHFYTVRRLQTMYADTLSGTTETTLRETQKLLKQITTIQQYFKTIYLQRSLSQLSRLIVYTGAPATLISGLMVLIYRKPANAPIDQYLYFALIGAVVAVTLSPLVILFSYSLQIATISRKTAAFGPFIPQKEQEQVEDESHP